MQAQTSLFTSPTTMPVALYSSQQLYDIEQSWFDQGHNSFGLMQQAAWQMTQRIEKIYTQKFQPSHYLNSSDKRQRYASIWVGKGNNGGDGWLIAYYLQQAGWRVQVTTVGMKKDDAGENKQHPLSDAEKAQQMALAAHCHYQCFEDVAHNRSDNKNLTLQADVYVDAIFGIGLKHAPQGIYEQAITCFNNAAQADSALVVAIDVPSGLVASTGEVFKGIAIKANVTLCLIARKFGLHTKDGMDYRGEVIDIPLIPYQLTDKKLLPVASLLSSAYELPARRQNSHKGSYGHVLIIGGNRIDGSQGMGGAAILSASSAMATGAGKVTVACHEAFHGALLSALPDAMTIDLHDKRGVKHLIKDADILAIGMGLGRDEKAQDLFISYIQAAIIQGKSLIIDADGLYHLAVLQASKHEVVAQLKTHSMSTKHQVFLTPHSGEAAKLLGKSINEVESDRLATIKQCAVIYGGHWVLKGAGSLVLEQQHVYVCGTGNPGMATAGMGDVLSGLTAGLLAQQDLKEEVRSLHQAVLIHGLAGDVLVDRNCWGQDMPLLIGQRGLQAQDMPAAIRHTMHLLINKIY